MSRGRLWAVLAVLVLTASLGSVLWRPKESEGVVRLNRPAPAISPDLYATGLQVREYRADGSLKLILKSESLDHRNRGAVSHFSAPDLWTWPVTGSPWHTTSRHGQSHADDHLITLQEQVVMTQNDSATQTITTIETDKLRVNTDSEQANTDAAVRITREGEGGVHEVQAVGSVVEYGQGRVQLTSKVRATHEPG